MSKLYQHVLIIDDDLDLCNLLKELLVKSIPDISYVHTIQAGKNFLAENKPDVIFLDNNLPDGKGVDFISEIKSMSTQSLIIIISAMDSTRTEAKKSGEDVIIIDKPLTYLNISKALEESLKDTPWKSNSVDF